MIYELSRWKPTHAIECARGYQMCVVKDIPSIQAKFNKTHSHSLIENNLHLIIIID